MAGTTVDLKAWIQEATKRLGFDLCGIAPASLPTQDRKRYLWWLEEDFHGEMKYMERRERQDIRRLLPTVQSVICAAMVYNSPHPLSIECPDSDRGWISRYAWGEDYHFVLEERLQKLLSIRESNYEIADFEIRTDTLSPEQVAGRLNDLSLNRSEMKKS